MIDGHDRVYPAHVPSADFADRVVTAALRERRGTARRSAWLQIASVSLASASALLCVVSDVHRSAARERAARVELAEEEQAIQARLDAHMEKLDSLLRAIDAPDESRKGGEPPKASASGTPRAQRSASLPAPARASHPQACNCSAGDPLCSCL
jgi:hypothetical protein